MNTTERKENTGYYLTKEWTELYTLTEHWKSDLIFYLEDTRFMRHLIEKYFLWLTKDENMVKVKHIAASVFKTELEADQLLKNIVTHLLHLEELTENPFAFDAHQFREEHALLELEIAAFVKKYRENKSLAFSLTEHVMESENLIYLMEKWS